MTPGTPEGQPGAGAEFVPPPPGEPPNEPPPGFAGPPPPPGGPRLTPDDVVRLILALGPAGKYIIESLKWKVQQDTDRERARARHSSTIIGTLFTFLGAVIGLMTWLTYAGKVSGDALLFLVGTVSGATLIMIQRHLFETEPEDSGVF